MTSRHKRPDNRLTLVEFIQCLVRLSFMRANPKHGTYDNKSKVLPLPECFEVMMKLMLENAKQDKSSLFREELREDEKRQAVFSQYLPELKYWFSEVTRLTAVGGNKNQKSMTMDVFMDIARGNLTFHRSPIGPLRRRRRAGTS